MRCDFHMGLALGSSAKRGDFERVNAIRIRGARQHNLRNIDVDVPRDRLVVITGPSGCGKSSLAFHTLFAEGQRRYVESLSVYARQFLDQLERPDVDAVEGLSPAIAIEQRSGGLNPRSTVATATELYDYLRVLWAAIGVPHDPQTGERLERMGSEQIVESVLAMEEGSKVMLLAPVPQDELREPARVFADLQRQGYVRVRVDGEVHEIDEALARWTGAAVSLEIVVDRLVVRAGMQSRVADSVEAVLRICGAEARVAVQAPDAEEWQDVSFQTAYRNPRTGFMVGDLSPRYFSFNSHLGACACCEGLGTEEQVDASLLMGDPSLPVHQGGLRAWWPATSARERQFQRETAAMRAMFGIGEDVAIGEWPSAARQLLMEGGELDTGWRVGREKSPKVQAYEGLVNEAWRVYRDAKHESLRRRLSRLMVHRPCHACSGRRLKPEWLAVKVPGRSWLGIQEFCELSVADALQWMDGVEVPPAQAEVCERLLEDLRKRLSFLAEVGLDYLTLDRASGTLSGGEAQRIRLATQLGSGLSGVIYVLDEPSIGLHPADTGRLIQALLRLRDLGNTVVVVEHDEAIIRAADYVIDMGPGAGAMGGLVLAAGSPHHIDSPTGEWLRRKRQLPSGPASRSWDGSALVIRGASEHNLRGIDVRLPLGCLTVVCGPSGSGKSTLIDDILCKALKRHFHGAGEQAGRHEAIDGLEHIAKCVVADQSPIGRSPRSNPATFTGAFDWIRSLFAQLPASKQRGYGAGRFSFNAVGGRCERCQGNGRLKIEMHFLPDAWVLCPACSGKRFNRETLEVTYKGRSIADVLDMQVAEALDLFRPIPKLRRVLATLDELGLGYLRLGQAANTLSGGESQRLKLALELARPVAEHTLYLFDEPTTGLHFGDVERLLGALRRLVDAGHSVLVVEHHPQVMAAADWVVELGPGGGVHGGALVAEGTPADLLQLPASLTGRVLADTGALI